MARTSTPAVKAALKNPNKSEGMRELLGTGMAVKEVAEAFDAQYGFVYGVARRAGLVNPTPRAAKTATPAARSAKPATTKAPARTTKAPARATKASARPAKTKVKAKA